MSYKITASSLILAVLPSLASAQSTTQSTGQPTIQAQAQTMPAVYRPGVVSANAAVVNRAVEAAPFTPAKTAETAPGTKAATTQAAVAKPVVAAIPASAAPAVRPTTPATPVTPAATPATISVEPDYAMAVDFRQGKLSLVAQKAPLGKLMALVATKTGARIDVASDVATELVAAKLGPASASEVLSALLDGPKIEYIILGASNESGIQRVLIRRKQGLGRQPAVPVLQPTQQAESATDVQSDAQNTQPAATDGAAAPQPQDPPQQR